MATPAILSRAATSFGFDVNALFFISNSTNEVYRFTKHNESFILRLSEKPPAHAATIMAELDWLSYLARNGVRVSLPIRTVDNELTAIYEGKETCFIATAFSLAPGRFFDKDDPLLWGPGIFREWGETMGKMHLHSKSYIPSDKVGKRADWSRLKTDNPCLRQGKYLALLQKLMELENRIESLPRDRNSYGLIHHDFHPYNFHISKDGVTVFDFDDSIYGWFSLDIAIAAAHAVWWGSPNEERASKNEFARMFLDVFLEGYFKHNHLDRDWIQRIPMFMEYRNICSFFWWLDPWDGDESKLSAFQKSAVSKAVHFIENGLSFDGCGIRL